MDNQTEDTAHDPVAVAEGIIYGDDQIVKVVVKMRDRIAAMTKEYDAAVKVVKDQKQQLENELLSRLQQRGATQTKTVFGTAFVDESMKVTIADEGLFQDFVRSSGDLDFYQRRVKIEHLREYLKENGDRLPPGLSVFREVGITIRVTK